jgi:hypothetical protein
MRPRALVAIIVLDLVGITSAAGAAGSRISRTLGRELPCICPAQWRLLPHCTSRIPKRALNRSSWSASAAGQPLLRLKSAIQRAAEPSPAEEAAELDRS